MLKVAAIIYICAFVGTHIILAVKKTDRYFWKGVLLGLILAIAILLFVLSVTYLLVSIQ